MTVEQMRRKRQQFGYSCEQLSELSGVSLETVQKIFKKLYDQGDIYLDSYEDWYCTPCESFWTETQPSTANPFTD